VPSPTDRIVIGRRRNTGESRRPGERRVRAVPREHWTWAGDGNEHPALISMELWETAQEIGRKRGSVRDHTAPPAGTGTRSAPASPASSASAACAA
jgi:hypothetical protein